MTSPVLAHGISCEVPGGRTLFADLTFALPRANSALIGPNGIGKTTLARILAGELQATSASIQRRASVRLLPQREEPPEITVAAWLNDEAEWSLGREQLLRGIDQAAMCTTLSGGEWMRVRLARVLADEFLILDEPTNDLDRTGRAAVLDVLRQHRAGALVISHDRECLQLCDPVFELSSHGMTRFGGGWAAYLEARARERERLDAALQRARRERDRSLLHRAEQRARQERRNRHGAATAARGGAPAILLGQRKRRAEASTGKVDTTTLEQTEAAVRAAHAAFAEVKVEPLMYADIVGRELPAQKLIAQARDFNVCLKRWLYRRNLNFCWRGNARVRIAGANGAGKTTLLNAISGASLHTRGELRRSELTTLYIDQRCSRLDPRRTVFENVRELAAGSDSDVRSALARFLFAGEVAFRKVADLSGGERLRAVLAHGFLAVSTPELLILDEPTNNLDLANVEFLERVVRGFSGAVLVVSHDEHFLHRCAVSDELSL